MQRPSALSVAAATAVVVAAGYGLAILTNSDSGASVGSNLPVPGGVPRSGSEPATAVSSTSSGELDRLIGVFEDRTLDRADGTDLTVLGELYLLKARQSGDTGLYQQAADVLERALGIGAGNLDAQTLLATARLGLHEFTEAERLAVQVEEADPSRLEARVVVGDARFEIGNVAGARMVFEELDAELPDNPAIEARLARLAFLEGDAGEALSLAAAAERHAATGAAPTTDLAWYRSYLGILQFDAGRYDQASSHFEAAISADPSLPTAVAGLAQTRAAQGRLNEAIELYIEANNLIVDPGLLAALGDAYQAAGDPDIATAWHDSAEAIARQASQGTIAFNRDLSLFLSDHERDPAEALALAEADLEVRQDLFTYDTYAWALYRNGRFTEARAAADQALALDTPDPHLWYHAGVISAALDEATRAITELERALELSPNFHPLQARHARQLLESLTTVG